MMDVALTPSCGLIIVNTHLHSVRMSSNNDMASKYLVVIRLLVLPSSPCILTTLSLNRLVYLQKYRTVYCRIPLYLVSLFCIVYTTILYPTNHFLDREFF